MIVALLLLAGVATIDPRIELLDLQLSGQPAAALERVDEWIEDDPEGAEQMGLPFLRGHLLEELGRTTEAQRAFGQALVTLPALANHSRFRLALIQTRLGHPEVAAGLLAGLLASEPPEDLVDTATDLLVRSLEGGGDCRLLAHLLSWRIPEPDRRKLLLARADCALSQGDREAALSTLTSLLVHETGDAAANGAAERIDELFPEAAADPALALRLGTTFHEHRLFDRSTRYLAYALGARAADSSPVTGNEEAEALYALARGHFWLQRYLLAASRFGQLAARLSRPTEKARALYQQGRCYELHGNWDLAANSFRLAYTTDPSGSWAGASLFSALRLEWRLSHEGSALDLYELLSTRRGWLDSFGRSAIFLAASDIVRGRADRAAGWLEDAARSRQTSAAELDYWRGRLEELSGESSRAIEHYVAAYAADPFDPLARAAAERLSVPALAGLTVARARQLATSGRSSDLATAWLLLGDEDPAGHQARATLYQRLRANAEAKPFLLAAPEAPGHWPLWSASLRQPDEMLMALGIFHQSVRTTLRQFPVSEVPLGVTASMLLARAGEHRSSLYVAEILQKRVPGSLPEGLLPEELRRLLYPFPHRDRIREESRLRGVDPNLLAAVIREESRFDPQAVSAASARGLTQFVLPTARRLAGRIGLENLEVADLHEPAVSIALGAGYLGELLERFDGETHSAVAAYNAGEDQAQLWRSYCYSREPAEYLTKVTFSQTRAYLSKVLRSRNEYAAVWGGEGQGATMDGSR